MLGVDQKKFALGLDKKFPPKIFASIIIYASFDWLREDLTKLKIASKVNGAMDAHYFDPLTVEFASQPWLKCCLIFLLTSG